jgi:tetraacyldisaccharide 4'-kinase
LGLLSAIYSVTLLGRRLIYKSYLKKPKKLPAKVISIGNLTLGGTGKTPAVIAIAEEAKRRGFKPCILTRGYKGKASGPCFVSKGGFPLLTVKEAGDEPYLMAERLRDVPIVMGKNRYKSGIFAIENLYSKAPSSELLFILDDGFQHWSLHRDIDVLLIDATNPFGNGKLFPEGILREPLKAMRRAHIVVMTKADMICNELMKAINLKIKEHNPDAILYISFHKPIAFVNTSGEIKNLDSLKYTPVYAFAGIANPQHFKVLLSSIGADVVRFKSFRDHHPYKQQDINKIKKDASGLKIITTEKDLVRLKGLRLPEDISALRIEFSIGEEFYNTLFGGI